jgi:hypothetical protein
MKTRIERNIGAPFADFFEIKLAALTGREPATLAGPEVKVAILLKDSGILSP